MEVYQLIYQSQSLVPFDEPELRALLQQARTYNKAHQITGILLYTPDGRFLQVLEGSQQAVRDLFYNHIAVDPRHFNCRVFGEAWCLQRSFSKWSMSFHMAQARLFRKLLGYIPPDTPALLVPRPRTCPELVALLLNFLADGEIEPLLEQQS